MRLYDLESQPQNATLFNADCRTFLSSENLVLDWNNIT